MTNQHTFELGMALANILKKTEEATKQANRVLADKLYYMDQKMRRREFNIVAYDVGLDFKSWLVENMPTEPLAGAHFDIAYLSKHIEQCESYHFPYKGKILNYYYGRVL